ncbi:MAG: AAA family ATPase [Candidatus Diapherotrites archaeon]
MKENIFSKSLVHELFKDERFLYPESIPERLPHRDREIEEIAFALKPLSQGRKPTNLFLAGKSGTGKTVTAKFVLQQLQEFTDRVKSLYVNCFEFNSRTSILTAISNFAGWPTPRRGIAVDEIYSRMISALKKAGFSPVIVLDELDQLIQEGEASKLLYDLLRIIEFEKIRLGLIIISNDFSLTSKLDARVKSSLCERIIIFDQYSPQQLKDILNDRVQNAFFPEKVERDVVNVAAARAAKTGGDARIAIECLLKAGRLAEKENSARVELRHLKQALNLIDESISRKKVLPFLDEKEILLIKILSEKGSMNSGSLLREFSLKKKISIRHFREIVNELEDKKIIDTKKISLPTRGKSREVSLAIKKELIKEILV